MRPGAAARTSPGWPTGSAACRGSMTSSSRPSPCSPRAHRSCNDHVHDRLRISISLGLPMNIMRTASNPLTLGLCVLAVASSGPSLARSGKPADGPPAAVPDQKKLTADEARRADQLDQEIDKDLQS